MPGTRKRIEQTADQSPFDGLCQLVEVLPLPSFLWVCRCSCNTLGIEE